ncbi:helix-turn-helix domain-containing protein [Vaginisenegalia massiliensis]|uniref:helix-turn-helix domain-containing protein n=1 Tax=Vaginisenegalia massiliensis TaxID=2058294 RepID=UPI000F52EC18|nr:helix-turn-helix domain-containing protein [Vaginisenegalia massiliensis]
MDRIFSKQENSYIGMVQQLQVHAEGIPISHLAKTLNIDEKSALYYAEKFSQDYQGIAIEYGPWDAVLYRQPVATLNQIYASILQNNLCFNLLKVLFEDEEISSINQLADQLYINKSYCSDLITRINQVFVDYQVDIKIETQPLQLSGDEGIIRLFFAVLYYKAQYLTSEEILGKNANLIQGIFQSLSASRYYFPIEEQYYFLAQFHVNRHRYETGHPLKLPSMLSQSELVTQFKQLYYQRFRESLTWEEIYNYFFPFLMNERIAINNADLAYLEMETPRLAQANYNLYQSLVDLFKRYGLAQPSKQTILLIHNYLIWDLKIKFTVPFFLNIYSEMTTLALEQFPEFYHDLYREIECYVNSLKIKHCDIAYITSQIILLWDGLMLVLLDMGKKPLTLAVFQTSSIIKVQATAHVLQTELPKHVRVEIVNNEQEIASLKADLVLTDNLQVTQLTDSFYYLEGLPTLNDLLALKKLIYHLQA